MNTFTKIRNTFSYLYEMKALLLFTLTSFITSFSSTDMVGILASGSIIKGFANSLGQFNWHENYSFNFQPLNEVYLQSSEIFNNWSPAGDITYVYLF